MEYEIPIIDIKQGTKKLLAFHSLNMIKVMIHDEAKF